MCLLQYYFPSSYVRSWNMIDRSVCYSNNFGIWVSVIQIILVFECLSYIHLVHRMLLFISPSLR